MIDEMLPWIKFLKRGNGVTYHHSPCTCMQERHGWLPARPPRSTGLTVPISESRGRAKDVDCRRLDWGQLAQHQEQADEGNAGR